MHGLNDRYNRPVTTAVGYSCDQHNHMYNIIVLLLLFSTGGGVYHPPPPSPAPGRSAHTLSQKNSQGKRVRVAVIINLKMISKWITGAYLAMESVDLISCWPSNEATIRGSDT